MFYSTSPGYEVKVKISKHVLMKQRQISKNYGNHPDLQKLAPAIKHDGLHVDFAFVSKVWSIVSYVSVLFLIILTAFAIIIMHKVATISSFSIVRS